MGYEDIVNRASEETIIESIEGSRKTAKVEVEMQVEWDEKEDMMRGLLKKLLNNEISMEEYKMVSKDIRDNF